MLPSRFWNRFALAALLLAAASAALADETLILEVSGVFEERPGAQYNSPAIAYYDVDIPARGWFRSHVEATPALFNGPDGNNPYYHRSATLDHVGETPLSNWTTTDIEVAPIIVERSALLTAGGIFPARVVGPHMISFTWGDFIYGDPQSFTAQGYFDPSPEADAGPALAVEAGTESALLGSGSDADGDALTYQWTRVFGPGLGLSDATEAQPTFTAPNVSSPTTTRMKLVVSDSRSSSVEDFVDVLLYPTGGNIPPLVSAGPDASGVYETVVALDGSGSMDLDGSVEFYSWTQTGGPRVALSDAASATPTFKQYEPVYYDQVFTFELIVSDGYDLSAADVARVLVEGFGNAAVPVGPREFLLHELTGAVPEVTAMDHLNGTPPATLEFPGLSTPEEGRLRTEVIASPGLFNGPDGNNPGFHLTSHASHWDGAGTYGFRQTDLETAPVISNTYFDIAAGGARTLRIAGPQALSYTFYDYLYGEGQSFDVNVWFRPASVPPIADAGQPQTVYAGRVAQLDGRGSSDQDSDPLSYEWTKTAGPSVSLSNTAAAAPLFKAPNVSEPTTLTFQLRVYDGQWSAQAATVDVEVIPAPPPSFDVLDHILGLSELTPGELLAADRNSDGEVNVADLILLVNEGF